MAETPNTFEDDRLIAAKKFAHTMIVVDDEARTDATPKGGGAGPTNVTTPNRRNAARAASDARNTVGGELSHPLNQKLLVDNALELGLVCAVVAPKLGQGITLSVANAAERADIVSLDWQMHGDAGESAKSIIKEIVRRDARKNGRLRLIAIYTGVNNRDRIFREILAAFPKKQKKELNIRRSGEQIISSNGLRVIWLFKSEGTQLQGDLARFQVAESDLPARLQKEFAQLSTGLLSNVALATIAAVRDTTHHTLGKFSSDMDAPYFHHRSLLPNPADAEEYAVSIVLSELKSAVDRNDVGDNFAGQNAIANRIRNLTPDSGTFTLKHQGDTGTHSGDVDPDYVIDLITNGYNKDNLPATFPRHKLVEVSLTSLFKSSFEAGRDGMMAFAAMTGVRAHPGSDLHGKLPRLGFGSVIFNKKTGYLLCLQAVCDAVKVKKEDRFFFVKLEVVEDSAEHIVPVKKASDKITYLGLGATKNAYNSAVSLNFSLTGPEGNQDVRAGTRRGAAGKYFKSTEGDYFKWIATLKARRAMRSAQRVSQQLTRIGFDEFEPFRLK